MPAPSTNTASNHGGKRPGAGRKPSAQTLRSGRRNTPHRPRPPHQARHPVHLTLRAAAGLPTLRGKRLHATIVACLRAIQTPERTAAFRVVHYSIQADHLHLLLETADRDALIRHATGLATRLARRINIALRRRGKLWGDRYFAEALTFPRRVRSALAYVLFNAHKHATRAPQAAATWGPPPPRIDPCSSAPWLDATTLQRLETRSRYGRAATNTPRHAVAAEPPPVCAPQTWLLRVGWQR